MENRERDLTVIDEGTIVLLVPETEDAAEWLEVNCTTEPWQRLCGAIVVEHRYAQAIIDAAGGNGLTVGRN